MITLKSLSGASSGATVSGQSFDAAKATELYVGPFHVPLTIVLLRSSLFVQLARAHRANCDQAGVGAT